MHISIYAYILYGIVTELFIMEFIELCSILVWLYLRYSC